MTWKFKTSTNLLVEGDRYERTFSVGAECPDSLLETAKELDVVDFVEPEQDRPVNVAVPEGQGAEEPVVTKAEMKKMKGAELRQHVRDDPELDVEGLDELPVKELRSALLAYYFPEQD
ncbi:MAG: hypothetical protein CMM07_25845 [Rhodopirellula sp.]|nr:hypothetical protein [Rhodopirellula sp.]